MSVKRKISARKIIQVSLTVLVSICCIVAIVSAARIEGNEKVASVAVHLRNGKKYHFIEQNEIMDLVINKRNIDIANTTLSQLDIQSMEQILLSDPWIAAAEVYIDNDRVLQIYVTQRVPVARLFQQNNASCYLDTTLSIMPLSKNFIYYTTVVTNVPELKNDSLGTALKKQIVTLARTIQADSFWNAQVSQVIVDSVLSFELAPVLGNQQIIFGDITGMKEKFSNLFIFYKNVLNRIGWDKYDKLDVRFNGQVIASPSLPYKGPVDKAVVTMNWINSMVESSGDGSDEKDTVKQAATKPVDKQAKEPVKKEPKQAPAKADKQKAKPGNAKKEDKNKKDKDPKDKKKAKSTPDKKDKNRDKDKKSKDRKDKDNNTKKNNSKQATPKYVYPEKK